MVCFLLFIHFFYDGNFWDSCFCLLRTFSIFFHEFQLGRFLKQFLGVHVAAVFFVNRVPWGFSGCFHVEIFFVPLLLPVLLKTPNLVVYSLKLSPFQWSQTGCFPGFQFFGLVCFMYSVHSNTCLILILGTIREVQRCSFCTFRKVWIDAWTILSNK